MLEVLASSPQPVGGLAWATPIPIDTSETYLQMIDEFIRSVADSGPAVIVGHGAPAILASRPDVLRCLITAPDAVRAARVAAETGLDAESAKKRVRTTDQEWGSFLKNSHNIDWLRTSNYDLVINTGRMPFEAATNLIVKAASAIG
jgi:cytidylate kinase